MSRQIVTSQHSGVLGTLNLSINRAQLLDWMLDNCIYSLGGDHTVPDNAIVTIRVEFEEDQ